MPQLENFLHHKEHIGVVGLGYVGLPLAVILSKKYSVVGYDISRSRIDDLINGYDLTNEFTSEELQSLHIDFTNESKKLSLCKLIIVAVPTPINPARTPDLKLIKMATKMIGEIMTKGTTIVYESTVYPGLTEEICIPLLEKISSLKWKKDFFVGYSPERVNPGDPASTITKVTKLVSGDTDETKKFLCSIYSQVIERIHPVNNIKTAEAAKVIENTQRDLNIALINELSIIFDKMQIRTSEVLAAAGTKWNFLKFEPGLVGGHCIGVDPYYLTYKAEYLGFHPQTILAGRRINDTMGKYVADKAIKMLIQTGKPIKNASALILGVTFKENINDIRNSKVVDIYHTLNDFGLNCHIHDPLADHLAVKKKFNISLIEDLNFNGKYDLIILAVKHKYYCEHLNAKRLKQICSQSQPIVIDIKNIFSIEEMTNAGFNYWSL